MLLARVARAQRVVVAVATVAGCTVPKVVQRRVERRRARAVSIRRSAVGARIARRTARRSRSRVASLGLRMP